MGDPSADAAVARLMAGSMLFFGFLLPHIFFKFSCYYYFGTLPDSPPPKKPRFESPTQPPTMLGPNGAVDDESTPLHEDLLSPGSKQTKTTEEEMLYEAELKDLDKFKQHMDQMLYPKSRTVFSTSNGFSLRRFSQIHKKP